MPLIRLQNKVPPVYVEESRDFQLYCRLYDVIINGLKYDIDGIENLINTDTCKSTILQLLQTKLGFFTEKNLTDEALRYILKSFILLVRKKGTKEAIQQAVYMFLKINKLETSIKVDIINDKPTTAQKLKYGSHITDHCILIGIESSVRDTTPLYEVLKYIIPFGYSIFFYFFSEISEDMLLYEEQSLRALKVSNDVNSTISGYMPPTSAFKPDGDLRNKWDKLPDEWEIAENGYNWYKDTFLKDHINTINSTEIIPQNEDDDYPVDTQKPRNITSKENVIDVMSIDDKVDLGE